MTAVGRVRVAGGAGLRPSAGSLRNDGVRTAKEGARGGIMGSPTLKREANLFEG
jgi:hypothetical protein